MKTSKQKPKVKKSRVDAKINQWKIAKIVIKNPLKTIRTIAKETWLWTTTVYEHLQEIKTNKDERIVWICDTDLVNVTLWQNELQRRLQEEAKDMRASDIIQMMAEWTKRYTIFKWDITDEEWGLKLGDINDKDVLDYIK